MPRIRSGSGTIGKYQQKHEEKKLQHLYCFLMRYDYKFPNHWIVIQEKYKKFQKRRKLWICW